MTFFYRFRSTNALLDGWQELEKQEIYFSEPEQLNDPMEGFKDVFWFGDEIVWKNLIKHYLLCLIRMLSLFIVGGESYDPKSPQSVVFSSSTNYPSPEFAELHRSICRNFFSDEDVEKIPRLLSQCKHPIRREELKFYLRGLHGWALTVVSEEMRKHGLLLPVGADQTSIAFAKKSVSSLMNVLFKNISQIGDQERGSLNTLFSLADQLHRKFGLIQYFETRNKLQEIWSTAVSQYPDEYVISLDNLIFYKWYTACFVSAPHQAAMWGNYGDSHRGVCMKFQTSNTESPLDSLNLRRIVGWGGGPNGGTKHYSDVQHPFHKMRYVDRFIEVDFFRSIGRTTVHALMEDWYRSEDGKISTCANEIFANENEWMKKYLERFQSMISTKFVDWKHEDEHRLVLYSMLGGFDDPADRKLTYQFENLAGIIFGINTPSDQKKRIVDVIRQKCVASNRTEFEFGQAYYSVLTGKIEIMNQHFL